MRIIGLDYGDKNIGAAVSDPTGLFARGIATLRRDDPNAYRKTVSEIKELVSEYGAELVVLGYPKNMNDSEGERCKKTLVFKERLERALNGVGVELFDERLSAGGADRALSEAGLSAARKKELIDMMAAVYILQGYLDLRNSKSRLLNKETKKMNDDFDNGNTDDIEDDEYEVITFTSDDGETMECIVIDSCEHEGATYLLVVNADEAEDDDAPADILKEIDEGDDKFSYEFIEDDDEFEKIAAIFEEENEDYELL